MSDHDPYATTPRKAPNFKNQPQRKTDDGSLPSTPAKTPRARYDKRQGGYSEAQGSDSQTPRQPRKTPNTNKANRHATGAFPIASLDGTTSTLRSPQKMVGNTNNVNYNKNMTPAKQAYAGPTFHASPAPSSLPIPKFFSKSVPAGGCQAPSQAQSSTSPVVPSIPPSPSPVTDGVRPEPHIHRESSPLDLFFNAHRAEQALQKAGNGAQTSSPRPQLSNAHASSQSTIPSRLNPAHHPVSQPQLDNMQRSSGKEMFMMELDGVADQTAAEETTSTISFKDRITAVQTASSQYNPPIKATLDDQARMAKTLALKQLLKGMPSSPGDSRFQKTRSENAVPYMNGATGLPSHFPQHPHGQPIPAFPPFGQSKSTHRPFSQDAPTSTPIPRPVTTRNTSSPADVKTMEADLRRLLKLDPRS